MDMKSLNRANEIHKRLDKLKTMRKWLEAVAVSSDMTTVLLGMCISEAARLQKEFENL